MTNARQLDALARELRLTNKQRAFAEALAADTRRNQTKAAIVAGLGKDAAAKGSRMARVGKVQKYITAITAAATEEAIRRAGTLIMDAAEVQERLSVIGRAPVENPKPSVVLGALQTLAKINGREKPEHAHGPTINGSVFVQLAFEAGIPKGKIGEMGRRLLQGLSGSATQS